MDQVINDTKQKMQKILEVLHGDLATVRTGRATPSLVEHITINAYGGAQKLRVMELGTIGSLDAQTLTIAPFDSSIIGEIQKGIIGANIGLTPTIDGQIIRISIPPLSQERREQLTHLMKQKLENARIMIRQVRHEAMAEIRRQQLDKTISEDESFHLGKEVQKVTDLLIGEVEMLGKRKEEDLLQI